jgi:hypothetical protein
MEKIDGALMERRRERECKHSKGHIEDNLKEKKKFSHNKQMQTGSKRGID